MRDYCAATFPSLCVTQIQVAHTFQVWGKVHCNSTYCSFWRIVMHWKACDVLKILFLQKLRRCLSL